MNRRSRLTVIFALLTLLVAGVISPALAGTERSATPTARSAAAAATACPSKYGSFPRSTNPRQQISADSRPVVFVHGWNANSDGWNAGGDRSPIAELRGAMPNLVAYTFDYRDFRSTWAAAPGVAGCLGLYIDTIGAAYEKAGGDGKVLAVAHSMGGLALLYSTSSTYAEVPSSRHLSGIVTLDTPFLGSPFGNTRVASWLQGKTDELPPPGSDASICLNLHRKGAPIPFCSWGIPPALPATVSITQVAGEITLHRKLFGINVYDVPLVGDGIVSTTSQHGYASMSAEAPFNGGHIDTSQLVRCDVDYDYALAAGLPLANAGTFSFDLLSSGAIFDFMQSGAKTLNITEATPILVALLEGIGLGNCSHTNITKNRAALAATATALRMYDAAARKAAPTRVVEVTPFFPDGRVRLKVDSSMGSTLDLGCSESPSARTPNIYRCGSVAASLPACWPDPAASSDLYCLHSPNDRAVGRLYRPSDLKPVSGSPTASPWEIELDDGSTCQIRLGGAWPKPPDGYFYSYSCGTGGYSTLVAPANMPTVDSSKAHWTVHAQKEFDTSSKVVTVGVRKVIYAGPAPVVPPASTGAACPTAAELQAALEPGLTLSPESSGGIRCVGDWANSAYQDESNAYPGLYRKSGGKWRVISREGVCTMPSPIPAALYSGTCRVS